MPATGSGALPVAARLQPRRVRGGDGSAESFGTNFRVPRRQHELLHQSARDADPAMTATRFWARSFTRRLQPASVFCFQVRDDRGPGRGLKKYFAIRFTVPV